MMLIGKGEMIILGDLENYAELLDDDVIKLI